MFNCKFCDSERKNKNSLVQHQIRCPKNPDKMDSSNALKAMNNCNRTNPKNQYTKAKKLGLPVPKMSDETKKKIAKSKTGLKHTDETKKKLSEWMKKAHEEGRAHNIGSSRWNNEPSYPEQFFMKVIENEFDDKDYVREYGLGIYSLDFAWEHKKKCIEIDGDQHQRFEEYKARDERKNLLIQEEGWDVLRIVWKDMFNDPKKFIKIAKEYVG